MNRRPLSPAALIVATMALGFPSEPLVRQYDRPRKPAPVPKWLRQQRAERKAKKKQAKKSQRRNR